MKGTIIAKFAVEQAAAGVEINQLIAEFRGTPQFHGSDPDMNSVLRPM